MFRRRSPAQALCSALAEQFVEMMTNGTEPFLREEPLVYQRREGGYIDPPVSGEVG